MANKKNNNIRNIEELPYHETTKSRGVIKLSEFKKNKAKFIYMGKEVKDKNGEWVPRQGKTTKFTFSFRFITNIITNLIEIAKRHGFNLPVLSKEKEQRQIATLKQEILSLVNDKKGLEDAMQKLKEKELMNLKKMEELKSKIVKDNLNKFKKDLEEFKNILAECKTNNVKEEELQKFLKDRTWIFGIEYHQSKPKKPIGSKNIMDFYLEDFKGQGTIIELKLPSEAIFKEEYETTPKIGESLGQLIKYMESTMAYSYGSETSRIEEVKEIRPQGFLIIGRTENDEEKRKLKIINSYYKKGIEIMSYDSLLWKAQNALNFFSRLKD